MRKGISITEKSIKVRFLSALTSIMILVMTAVPNLTVSAIDVSSLNGSNPTTDINLLVGNLSPLAENAENVNEVISNADKTYLLGIASQFCVFLQDDFIVSDADAEGRVAVGGNIEFNKGWNYQIGSGDFATLTKIENLTNINGLPIYYTGASHIIAGGSYIKNVNIYGSNGGTEDQSYRKIFALGSSINIDDCSKQFGTGKYEGDDLSYMYKADLIDFNAEFSKLQATSQKITQQSTNGTAEWSGNTLNLTCTDPSAKVVYFNIADWNANVDSINYIDIPEDAYVVLTCDDTEISIDGNENRVNTTINGTIISNTGSIQTNNNKESSRIIYNFNNASTVYIDANFNGTILAPNADVTSDDACNGHLSGALIAKTFEGGLEFGYRPYQGTIDMLKNTTNGYPLAVAKFDSNSTYLAGAELGLYDANDELVTSWISTGSMDYINIPSAIDYSGETDYSNNVDGVDTTYTIKEISPPKGYALTDTVWTILLSETVSEIDINNIPTQVDTIIAIDSDNLDSYMAGVTVTYSANQKNIYIDWSTDDIDTSQTANIIITLDDDGNPNEILYSASSNGVTNSIGTSLPMGLATSQTFVINGLTYYYDADSLMVMPIFIDVLGEPTSVSFVNNKALTVSKLDDSGNYVEGAELTILNSDETDLEPAISWISTDSYNTIGTLDTFTGSVDNYFILRETNAPIGYEVAEDIYFYYYVTNETLIYKNASAIDWTTDTDTDLSMIDIKIDGTNVNLEKVDQDGNNLSGAIVDIYAYIDGTNDVKIASDVSLDKTDDALLDMSKVIDSNYVSNGKYVKTGIYYLVETTAPQDATLITDSQYFKVNDDGTITAPYTFSDVTTTSYNISQMAFSDDGTSDLVINSITVYFTDGTSQTVNTPTVSGENWWYSIDISSLNKNNIIGISIEATGTSTR